MADYRLSFTAQEIDKRLKMVDNLCGSVVGTNSGTEAIVINNVSPVEHTITVQLSSDTITDVSDLTVTSCGKNLFDKNNTDFLLDGYISSAGVYMASSRGEKSFIFKCKPNTNYVVSKLMSSTNRVAGFSMIPDNGTQGTYIGEYNGKTSYTFNSGNAEYIIVWYFNTAGEFNTSEEVKASI